MPRKATRGSRRKPRRRSPPKPALEARGLEKRYGERVALRDAGFAAAPGELLAVVGPNGAGKTTMLGILAGIIEPDAGEVTVSVGEVGWVPQQAALYRRLTVDENLRLFARLEEVSDPEGRVEAMLEQTGLADRRGDQVSELSGGNQQRINIAIGLLAEPKVLLLDEPSAGLDPGQRIRLWEFVASLAKEGTSVVYSTHQIEEAVRYGDRLLAMAEGEVLFDGTFAAMRRAAGARGRSDPETDFVRFLEKKGK